ncbi:MAG: hypothetical protein ISP49_11835 [Reyranella sp.]|nr:hypothetical protein [Reyranella sp.]
MQNAAPLQAVAPVAVPGGLNALSMPNVGGLPPAPPADGPALALAPAQLATLSSGNVTSMNQLLAQLVGSNLSSSALAALVDTVVTPQPTFTATSAPTPTPSTPTFTPTTYTPPTPAPVPTNPVQYVSGS